jgi:hypothetical protein
MERKCIGFSYLSAKINNPVRRKNIQIKRKCHSLPTLYPFCFLFFGGGGQCNQKPTFLGAGPLAIERLILLHIFSTASSRGDKTPDPHQWALTLVAASGL